MLVWRPKIQHQSSQTRMSVFICLFGFVSDCVAFKSLKFTDAHTRWHVVQREVHSPPSHYKWDRTSCCGPSSGVSSWQTPSWTHSGTQGRTRTSLRECSCGTEVPAEFHSLSRIVCTHKEKPGRAHCGTQRCVLAVPCEWQRLACSGCRIECVVLSFQALWPQAVAAADAVFGH